MTARGNGLRASAYAVLVEIEESLGDRLLEALAERQIAAYVVSAAGPAGTTRLILHVDSERRIPAGIVLAGLTPALAGELPSDGDPPADSSPPPASAARLADDAVFAELVENFHRTPAERTWPAAEDLPPDPAGPPGPPPATARVVITYDPSAGIDRRRPAQPGPPRPVPDPPDLDEEDHYIPPPLPRLDPPPRTVRWAFVALGVGLALLLFPTLLAFGHGTSLDVAGVACVLGSAAILLARLRDRSPDDPDDGAVV
jgi:hypothetical protein